MRMRGIKALAAAASVAAIGWASQASATTDLTLVSASMDQNYVINVYEPGHNVEGAITNGVLFQVANDGGVTSLYGFCIDVFHNMYVNTTLNYAYKSNESDGGGLLVNPPQIALSTNQANLISDLVDTGYNLYYGEAPGGVYAAANADTEERLAAIQAAIWYTEDHSYVHPNEFSGTFATYFNQYTGVPGVDYVNTRKPTDKVFTIFNGDNQSFAIGWPQGVPEPTTWALMLAGFGGMGAMLRRQRKAAAATA
ncbi:MAG: PEPxxWA-CTERM sorting domain-containing protein [Phenylobacterium sp.]